jgi:hypothetical protein
MRRVIYRSIGEPGVDLETPIITLTGLWFRVYKFVGIFDGKKKFMYEKTIRAYESD